MLPAAFVALSVAVAATLIGALRSIRVGLAVVLWMALTWTLAATGVLDRFDVLPPRMLLVAFAGFLLTVGLSRSAAGARLAAHPLGWLVGFQAFRIAVEWLIHTAWQQGLAPQQMTWSGMNFDVVTGVSALVLAPAAARVPRGLLRAWNVMGLALLAWVVGVAVASFPTPFQILKPDNTWVVHAPYVWLPAVLVPAALLGHLALFRTLAGQSGSGHTA